MAESISGKDEEEDGGINDEAAGDTGEEVEDAAKEDDEDAESEPDPDSQLYQWHTGYERGASCCGGILSSTGRGRKRS
ncbi:hypothetical protein SLS60_009237 [Paraconiothyrium brasiliense]|uniref:Uncharacterized protein n=1 Tax=Paraconiothyrium brasiliense TaxID=300254 RepID=A0ABR3QWR1_9PLEO